MSQALLSVPNPLQKGPLERGTCEPQLLALLEKISGMQVVAYPKKYVWREGSPLQLLQLFRWEMGNDIWAVYRGLLLGDPEHLTVKAGHESRV